MNITFSRHIATHQSCCANFHLVKVALGIIGEIFTKNLLQLCRGMQVDILRCFRQGIGFNVDFSQVLVQFSQCQLDRRFHSIGINRRQLAVCNASCHAELSAEHRFGQFQQNSVLGRKQIQIASPCNTCFIHNLTDRGVFIPLFQKEADAHGQYFSLCFTAVSPQIYHLSLNVLVYILIISYQVQKRKRYCHHSTKKGRDFYIPS